MSDNINVNASKAILLLAGVEIQLRPDSYFPMGFLEAGDKRYKDLMRDFKNNGRLSQLLHAEAAKLNLPTLAKSDDFSARGLIEVNTKTNKHFKGFLHPRAAHVIALNWFKPEIASVASEFFYRFLAGDASLVHDVADRVDLVHGTKSLLTRTVVDKDESDETLAKAHAKAAQYQAEVVTLQSQLRDAITKHAAALTAQASKHGQDLSAIMATATKLSAQVTESSAEIALLTTKQEQATAQAESSSAEIARLTAQLAGLGVDSQRKADRLTFEIRKRRRLCKVMRQNDAANEKTLAVHLLQTSAEEPVDGTGEQPACNSMPARFIALRGVNEATNGLDHKIVHALIKECLAAIGENLMKFQRATGASRARLVGCISAILDEQAEDNANNPLTSNVFIANLLCANLKRVHGLQHATHLTLGALYTHVRRANRWFADRLLSPEFQLVQANDLAVVLGYEHHERPRLVKYNPCDIRVHFPTVGHN